jgi:hypothetical protein
MIAAVRRQYIGGRGISKIDVSTFAFQKSITPSSACGVKMTSSHNLWEGFTSGACDPSFDIPRLAEPLPSETVQSPPTPSKPVRPGRRGDVKCGRCRKHKRGKKVSI